MARTETIELAPLSDGCRFRRVTLMIAEDGAVALRSHELGSGPEAPWGIDDEEVVLTVLPHEVGRLALALAAELLERGEDAVGRLQAVCEAHGVTYRRAYWT
jgi:hypothetical protein